MSYLRSLTKATKKLNPEWRQLGWILLVTIGFRYLMVRGGFFQFHYEQVRDAIISRSIYESGDIKLLGPPAGNSGETLYHGVLYYYLIGVFYFIFQGNPEALVNVFVVLSSIGSVGVYYLTKKVSQNQKTAVVTAILWGANLSIARLNVQLFNIALASWIFPWVFLAIVRVLEKKRRQETLWMFILLGLLQQTGIYLGIYWFIVNGFLAWKLMVWKKQKLFINLVIGNLVYLVTILTIVAGQAMLWKRGIFSIGSLIGATKSSLGFCDQVAEGLGFFWERMLNLSFFPIDWINVLIVTGLLALGVLKKDIHQKQVLNLWFWTGVLLLIFLPRKTYYMTVGLGSLLIIWIGLGLSGLAEKSKGLFWVILGFYLFTNLQLLQAQRKERQNWLYTGAYYQDEIDLIDKTYKDAKGKDFSISSLNSPYKVNTTWAYLYDWYGADKYGYKPKWFGANQEGTLGVDMLEPIQSPLALHAVIQEDFFNPGDQVFLEFYDIQDAYSPIVEKRVVFPRLRLEWRKKLAKD